MDLHELEELKKSLCTDAHKRIEKLEARLAWYNTLLISTLIALILNFVKDLFVR